MQYPHLTPSMHIANFLKENGREYHKEIAYNWTANMVSRILQDIIYTGTLINHKTVVKNIHGKSIRVPEEEQFVFENHHTAIITTEQFNAVQKIIAHKKETTALYNKKKYDYVFGGFIKCRRLWW